MLKKLLFLVLALLLFSYCTREKPDIRVVCEVTRWGYYRIKWETFPPMEGTVKIFMSNVPDSFNRYSPIAEVEISKGFKDVFLVQTTKRSYFNLVFDKKYSVITAERNIPMQGLFNFRDLGGYYNSNGKQTCWGKLYRSSSLSRATYQDTRVLRNLGIRTVLDFRTKIERNTAPSRFPTPNTYYLPLRGNPPDVFLDKILSNKMKLGDVKVLAQGVVSFLLENNSDYFIKMFDVLLDENNYPVLLECLFGSERSAIAAALILAALGVDMDQIVNDYILSNKYLPFDTLINSDVFFGQDEGVQETLTALVRVHKGSITYSFDKIIKDYGTLDNYFNKCLNLTPEKREKLKEILLY